MTPNTGIFIFLEESTLSAALGLKTGDGLFSILVDGISKLLRMLKRYFSTSLACRPPSLHAQG